MQVAPTHACSSSGDNQPGSVVGWASSAISHLLRLLRRDPTQSVYFKVELFCARFTSSLNYNQEAQYDFFRLDASIRVDGSHSRALGDLVEHEWTLAHPGDTVIRRHLGTDPISSSAWPEAVSGAYVPAEDRSQAQADAAALAASLVDELVAADALVFSVPLYNFGVSQHFKTYVDLVITDPRMASGAASAITGQPAVLATVRGGAYGAGTPREGWDHATSWMRRILEDVWGLDLRVVEEEFALVGVNPALDQFADLAKTVRAEAAALATAHGRQLNDCAAAYGLIEGISRHTLWAMSRTRPRFRRSRSQGRTALLRQTKGQIHEVRHPRPLQPPAVGAPHR